VYLCRFTFTVPHPICAVAQLQPGVMAEHHLAAAGFSTKIEGMNTPCTTFVVFAHNDVAPGPCSGAAPARRRG